MLNRLTYCLLFATVMAEDPPVSAVNNSLDPPPASDRPVSDPSPAEDPKPDVSQGFNADGYPIAIGDETLES